MANLLNYKDEVIFDDYVLYDGVNDRTEEVGETLNGFSSIDINVCPCCIKKYNLYEECFTSVEENELSLALEEKGEKVNFEGMVCGVKGCENDNTLEGSIKNLDFCEIVKEEKAKKKGKDNIER